MWVFKMWGKVVGLGLLVGACAAQLFSEPFWNYGTYKGPSEWLDSYPNCGGDSQSPVALPSTWENHTFLVRFGWYNFELNRTWTIHNDHDRVVLGYKNEGVPAPYFKGSLFHPSVRFQFHKLIFHWGHDSTQGSEHSIDGWQYPGEMQFIGWDTRYKSYEQASKVPGGIAIAVFLLQLSKEDNSNFNWFLGNLYKINGTDRPAEMGVRNMNWVYPVDSAPTHDCEYYLYEGSSSYPPCNEVAVWHIYKDATSLSERQFDVLRSLKNKKGDCMSNNFRPIQPTNERKIWQHREVPATEADRPTARPLRPDERSTSSQSKTILTDDFFGRRVKEVAPTGFLSYREFQRLQAANQGSMRHSGLRDKWIQEEYDHLYNDRYLARDQHYHDRNWARDPYRNQHRQRTQIHRNAPRHYDTRAEMVAYERMLQNTRGNRGFNDVDKFRMVKPYLGPRNSDPTEGGYGR